MLKKSATPVFLCYIFIFTNKRGTPQRAATIGIWDMGDHTSKKFFEGNVYPGDPEKKFFFKTE